MSLEAFDRLLTPAECNLVNSLDNPIKIQGFLDQTVYNPEYRNRSPIEVLRDRLAHCLDGGVFAALMLRRLGYPPLLIDLFPEPGTDDDHVLAIFQHNGRWGAVAKSNYVGLRFRDAVYRSIHELVMTYFENYFNINALKTLRTHTRPLRLAAYDGLEWMTSEAGVNAIEKRLLQLKRIQLLTPEMIASLSPVDARFYNAGMLGINHAGIYKPE